MEIKLTSLRELVKTQVVLREGDTLCPVRKLIKLRKETTQRLQEVPETGKIH